MHIPDGFLSPPVWGALDVAAAGAIGILGRLAPKSFDQNRAPLLGVLGAFVFAAQMVNFPVGIGTSGHLVGAALLTFTVGPVAASIVMTAILILQCLVFQDGGVLALGANVVNMALAGTFAAYLVGRVSPPKSRWTYFLGGSAAVLTSAVLALSELSLSGVAMPGKIVWVSLALFAVSAAIEGGITTVVVRALERTDARFVQAAVPGRSRVAPAIGLLSLILVTAGILIASTHPDGIWSLAGQVGFANRAHVTLASPMPDYRAGFVGQPWLARAVAGVAGLGMVYLACWIISRFALRRSLQRPRGA